MSGSKELSESRVRCNTGIDVKRFSGIPNTEVTTKRRDGCLKTSLSFLGRFRREPNGCTHVRRFCGQSAPRRTDVPSGLRAAALRGANGFASSKNGDGAVGRATHLTGIEPLGN